MVRAWRTSGLLKALPADELKTLLVVLSFGDSQGLRLPSAVQLAYALGISEVKAAKRLERLNDYRWQDVPILTHILGNTMRMSRPATDDGNQPERVGPSASRNRVIEASRQQFTRPRAQVERLVDEQLGWATKTTDQLTRDTSDSVLAKRLVDVGLTAEQAKTIIARFDARRIERQLDWLPFRDVRNPVGFLIAAIEDDYAAPWHRRSGQRS